MKLRLIILILVLYSIGIAQSDDANSWQLHYIGKPTFGLRGTFDLNWMISNSSYSYGVSVPFVALAKPENHSEIKIASNSLLLVPAVLAYWITDDNVYFVGFMLFIALPNFHFSYEIIKGNIDLTFAQRTDFYLFRDNSKVYSESSLGVLIKCYGFGLRPNMSFPISQGYYNNIDPYIGLDLIYYIN